MSAAAIAFCLFTAFAQQPANQAYQILLRMTAGQRQQAFSKVLSTNGESCPGGVVRTFYQGMDKSGTATWDVACKNGRALAVSIANDANGSTKIQECSSPKKAGGASCFKTFAVQKKK